MERADLELRQQLARDGARLGKFVGRATVSRFSLNPAVEHWEEGFAIQALQRRFKSLKRKREALEQKLAGGYEVWWQGVEREQKSGAEDANVTSASSSVISQQEGRMVVDSMEREEFEAPIRVHLEELKKEENDLIKEEAFLRTETSKHQRALKRLANEDQSRFKRHSEQRCRVGSLVINVFACIGNNLLIIVDSPLDSLAQKINMFCFLFWEKGVSQRFGEHMIYSSYEKLP